MRRARRRQNGFTLLDVATASALTAALAITLSSTWILFGRPTSSLIAWGQLFQEMDIAAATLSRDLGGGLPGDQIGSKRLGLLLECKKDNTVAEGDHLKLCFDGGISPDGVATWTPGADTIIDYYVNPDTHKLMRQENGGTPVVVASNVESLDSSLSGMVIDEDPNNTNNLRVQLSFTFHFPGETGGNYWMEPLTRKCILIIKKTP